MTFQQIIEKFNLVPLEPEGGFFRQFYRSGIEIETDNGRRPAFTSIYYLLTADTFSAFHRLKSDEIYHYYAGARVELILFEELPSSGTMGPCSLKRIILGANFAQGDVPMYVVPAGVWQASRLLAPEVGAWSLLGTTVSPGFDMADFELAKSDEMARKFPGHLKIIDALCRR